MKKRFCASLTVLALTWFFIIPLFAQLESKVALITVSGSGKTQEEAKQNALRNAIEQAFGTFISSNTQILNDELVKDEIVSVSNGNIQEYTVISEVQTPDGFWSNTVRAKVAVDKLTSFCESKGVTVEFKGALFTLNIKQQILNEQNEIKAIANMCKVIKEISEKSFDYEIAAGEPISVPYYKGENDKWKIPLIITAKTNASFKTMSDYLGSTLKGLSLTIEEAGNYTKLGKEYQTISFCPLGYQPGSTNKKSKKSEINNTSPSLVYLRKKESLNALFDLMAFFRKSLLNFAVINDIRIIQGEDLVKDFDLLVKDPSSFMLIFAKNGYFLNSPLLYEPNNLDLETYCWIRELNFGDPKYSPDSKFFPFLAEFDANDQFDLVISFWLFNKGYTAAELSYDDYLTLDQLGKISGYKITPRIGGSEVDQDGNMFKTTYVGSQRWIAQDLNVTHFSNGDPIQGIVYREPEKWAAAKDAAYTNTTVGSGTEFKLYNWYTITDKRNVCPGGWHVPSEAEWSILTDFLGGKEIAGGKLKAINDERNDKYYWKTPNVGATNEFLFTAKSTDVRDGWGNIIYDSNENCFYWMKSDLNSANSGKAVIINNDSAELKIGLANAHAGLAIRCVKD